MDEAARVDKKIREARMLRDVPPAETLRMASSMMESARRLSEAGDRVPLERP